ncbi:MAG: AMP-binding protein [Solirubrobacteraceae bacterium]
MGRAPGDELFATLASPDDPDRPALSFPERTLRYGELRRAAAGVAGELAGAQRVAVVAQPRIETAVAVIGGLLAGAAVVPINPRSGASELAHVIGDCDPDAVVAAPGEALPKVLAKRPLATVRLDVVGETSDQSQDHDPERPALIVYTSGTTGPPKGAVLPRRALASNLDALAQVWEWTADDVIAHALPLFHVHGLVIGTLGPIRRGGTAMHLGRFSPEAVQAALSGPATMLLGVPTMYRRLADAADEQPALVAALAGARLLVSGSAALPASEHARMQRLTGRRVVERYGLTETLINTAIGPRAEPAPGTVGPPLPGVQTRLVDDDGAELDAHDDETIGELQVRGPNLFLGYLNRPDATAAALRGHGWFATGDMVTRTASGYIRIVGRRATDLIKSGGYKIGAGEIEACLREHSAVLDAAVTGEPDEDLGERVVAWVQLAPPAEHRHAPTEAQLIDHVASLLAPHKRPRTVRFVAELPRNELGKIQKRRLRA